MLKEILEEIREARVIISRNDKKVIKLLKTTLGNKVVFKKMETIPSRNHIVKIFTFDVDGSKNVVKFDNDENGNLYITVNGKPKDNHFLKLFDNLDVLNRNSTNKKITTLPKSISDLIKKVASDVRLKSQLGYTKIEKMGIEKANDGSLIRPFAILDDKYKLVLGYFPRDGALEIKIMDLKRHNLPLVEVSSDYDDNNLFPSNISKAREDFYNLMVANVTDEVLKNLLIKNKPL